MAARRCIPELATPVRIRLALSELGTTFIKFGQMLSTRPDLVRQDLARELTHLQSDTPPDPPGVAEATIEKELGSHPATLFAWFDPTPFASASIAQVHFARLHSGENVVVRFKKQGIEWGAGPSQSACASRRGGRASHVARRSTALRSRRRTQSSTRDHCAARTSRLVARRQSHGAHRAAASVTDSIGRGSTPRLSRAPRTTVSA
jgi:ABC1 atypical kinase-like domain